MRSGARSIRTAQTLNSGIPAVGSDAGLVRTLAAASPAAGRQEKRNKERNEARVAPSEKKVRQQGYPGIDRGDDRPGEP